MLTIRNAEPADIPAIASLYAEEVRERVATYEYDVPDEAEMTRRMREVVAAGYPYLAAELDGHFAGYAYASAYRSRIGYRWTVENTVYIMPGAQRRGVGKALMLELIEQCAARGFRQMIAVIGEPGNGASVALHQSLGFETVGIFRGLGRKHGRWLDTVQMQRALGPGDSTAPDNE
ncbi:MAG: GNAT family N-acetyltransferase [Xanthomonadaceae bacterium]|jgi:phosphinothricin acetyltransferase|nr:GNAT family N-acetyltransferase [Xanthomonadaceae bacterium]